jgi:hypothetical protein
MTQFSDWIQSNWFECGILVVLSAILGTVVWFARNILKSLRASQEQVGALLRLSFSEVLPVPAAPPQIQATQVPVLQERAPRGPNPLVVGTRHLVNWLNAPMRSRPVSPWRKAVRWLQAPARS